MTNRSAVTISVGSVLGVLAIIAVLLRLQARKVKRVALGADDWAILVGLLFSLALSGAAVAGAVKGNIGHHDYDAQGKRLTSMAQVIVSGKVIWVEQWTSTLGPGATKVSVILFYRRIFAVPNGIHGNIFNYACWFMLFVSVVWTIGFFFANLPNWNYTETNFTCVDLVKVWMSMAISDVIIDGLILTLPWIPLSKLHIKRSKKLMIGGIFLLGAFTIIAGILRSYAFHEATTVKTKDHGYYYAPATYWAVIEANVGVISACLPCLGPIFGNGSVTSYIDRAQSMWTKMTGRSSLSSLMTSRSSRTANTAATDEKGRLSDEESLKHKSPSHGSSDPNGSISDEEATVITPPQTNNEKKQIVRTTTITQGVLPRSVDDTQGYAMFGQPNMV